MRIVALAGLALVAGAIGFAAWVRLAPDNAERWHTDPLAGPFPGAPNYVVASFEPVPGVPEDRQIRTQRRDVAPELLLGAFDRVAMAAPRVKRLAGSVLDGRITYVQRSTLMGFPDYITVTVVEQPDARGSRYALVVFSRSRYGYSDLGMNRSRVTRWLAAVDAELGSPPAIADR